MVITVNTILLQTLDLTRLQIHRICQISSTETKSTNSDVLYRPRIITVGDNTRDLFPYSPASKISTIEYADIYLYIITTETGEKYRINLLPTTEAIDNYLHHQQKDPVSV